MVKTEQMQIGQVARRSGVNIQTVRYYERRGLLKQPSRLSSGYRQYGPEAVRLIRFVKRAQELGFSLDEIEDLLRLREDKTTSCPDVRAAAVDKIKDIVARMKNLRAMKRALDVLVRSCAEGGTDRSCPILEALDTDSASGECHGKE